MAIAFKTDGATLLGPGPISKRGGAWNVSGTCMSQTVFTWGDRGNAFAFAQLNKLHELQGYTDEGASGNFLTCLTV
jgi:hypothetical protein